jgi:TrmH family RNA methyltransferase
MNHIDNIRIVLVETSHPGNIGAAARAMKTMGLQGLYLVRPARFPHAEASVRASGADDLLAHAVCCEGLEEALQGCRLVVATSARSRSIPWPQLSPRACALRLVRGSTRGPVALLFGREKAGLSNAELDRCQYMVQIPCNPRFSSLNLAAAVQVLSYEIHMVAGPQGAVGEGEVEPPAEAEEVERFYEHLECTLVTLGFLDPHNPKHLMRRLRRLCSRARPTQVEVNILRGILTAAQRRKRPRGAP